MQLGYVGLEVDDLEAWEHLATDVLGLERADEPAEDATFLRLDEQHHRVALRRGRRDDLAYVGWQVRRPDELDQIAERLVELGFPVTPGSDEEARTRRVTAFVRSHDPDGVVTEVHHGALLLPERPFSSPRPIGGFVAGPLGLGHLVLHVRDLAESLRFYRDGLGLLISDHIDLDLGDGNVVTASFLHCGPRHHSLALVEVPSSTHLHHLMFEVEDLDDVGTTYDLCRAEGVPIVSHLGRHTNDRMLSFYLRTPSGWQIEYGHGGRLVDDATWVVQRYRSPSIWGHRPVG